MKIKQACIAFILFYFLLLKEKIKVYGEALNPSTDYKLNFTQMADKLGFKNEVHEVITEDKYILQLFRLPGDTTRPVFLLSGNSGTADDYIARGNTSLPAVLMEAGYDVWLGNLRGCRYGRRHVTLDPDRDDEFWNYSYHEYATYDVPALIDHVLNVTQQQRLACIGWSLGTTTFYVLGAIKPEYSEKVAVFISFAPFGYMYHSATLSIVLPFVPMIIGIAELFDMQEFFGTNSTLLTTWQYVCCSEELGYEICMKDFLFPTVGFDEKNLEQEFSPMIFGHFPSSESSKAWFHLAQGLSGHRIAHYDYGPTKNLLKYGSMIPPNYALRKNNMTIVMVSGMNDLISTLPDVELLKARLPNVVEHIILESAEFNHFDFVYGKNSHKILYHKYVLGLVKKYLS